MHDANRRDWARFAPAAIPTKAHVPQLMRWLNTRVEPGARVLDLGCGAGEITRQLASRGFDVAGVDLNSAAIEECRHSVSAARFYLRDVAGVGGLTLAEAPFDAIVCQLVVSVVGDASDRAQLLRNAFEVLRPEGDLFISFSARSEDLNEAYAELYARDLAATQTYGTYLSRDSQGEVLYRTHHFTETEARELLESSGYSGIAIEEAIEASSRRPDQRARFYYATCRRGV
jgi:2-polyprenyl-3-methyl-5-hydroxy-6-metoxy-1,4-benzoquinol methylase